MRARGDCGTQGYHDLMQRWWARGKECLREVWVRVQIDGRAPHLGPAAEPPAPRSGRCRDWIGVQQGVRPSPCTVGCSKGHSPWVCPFAGDCSEGKNNGGPRTLASLRRAPPLGDASTENAEGINQLYPPSLCPGGAAPASKSDPDRFPSFPEWAEIKRIPPAAPRKNRPRSWARQNPRDLVGRPRPLPPVAGSNVRRDALAVDFGPPAV